MRGERVMLYTLAGLSILLDILIVGTNVTFIAGVLYLLLKGVG